MKHGMSKHPAYAVYRGMRDRCTLPSHKSWHNYGGRGIEVCASWLASFENFWADMGSSYRKGLQLDRADNDKGYAPGNCRWVDQKTQDRNKRTNRHIDTPWGRMCVAEAAERSGVNKTTITYRLQNGWSEIEAVTTRPDLGNRWRSK